MYIIKNRVTTKSTIGICNKLLLKIKWDHKIVNPEKTQGKKMYRWTK